MNGKLQHYYLASVTLLFMDGQNMVSYPMNVMSVTDSPKTTRKVLGLMQQQAQVNLFGKFPEIAKTGVMDVIINGISYLGEMTHEEFHAGFLDEAPKPEEPRPLEELLREDNAKARAAGKPEPHILAEEGDSTEDEKSNG